MRTVVLELLLLKVLQGAQNAMVAAIVDLMKRLVRRELFYRRAVGTKTHQHPCGRDLSDPA